MTFYFVHMGIQFSWLERRSVKPDITGSSPVLPATVKEQAPFIKTNIKTKEGDHMVDYYYLTELGGQRNW